LAIFSPIVVLCTGNGSFGVALGVKNNIIIKIGRKKRNLDVYLLDLQ